MKIIEKIDVSNWSYNCQCSDCETKLEIEAVYLHYTHHNRDGIHPPSDIYSAKCPVCFNYINVLANEIPKIIQIEAQKRAPKNSSVW